MFRTMNGRELVFDPEIEPHSFSSSDIYTAKCADEDPYYDYVSGEETTQNFITFIIPRSSTCT
jgi:hypothetical protein